MERIIRCLFGLWTAALIIYGAGRCLSVVNRLSEAKERLDILCKESERLTAEKTSLERGILYRQQTDAMGELARERLGLILPEDRIYIVESEK